MKTHRKTMESSIWILLSITLIGCFTSTSREALHRFQALEGPFSVTVYPVNVITHDGTVHDAALAQRLIEFLREEEIAEGVLAEKDADIEFEKSGIQGKMAKNSSKAFMEFIKHQELETDYALLVDILKGWSVGGVHIYLVDKDGNMAQFGLTNSHWEEFKIVKPVTKEDGCTVAVMMMRRMWGKHPAESLVYVPGTSGSASFRTLVWVDKKGNEEQIEAEPNMYQYPKISPDGTKVALTSNKSGNDDIWIYDLTYKILERLTFDDSRDALPVWTSDGKRIIFWSGREEPGIYSKAADGTGKVEQISLMSTPGIFAPFSLSGDGNILVLQDIRGMTQIDIGTLSMGDDHTYELLLQEDYIETMPQLSPDGKYIAYCSLETGQPEIFVRPFPDINKGKWQISTDTGNSPLWSPDGRELFYLIGGATAEAAMGVAVETEPTFKKGTPEELFRGTYVGFYPGDFPWAIHPDGNRFLMLKRSGTPDDESATEAPQKINIVLN